MLVLSPCSFALQICDGEVLASISSKWRVHPSLPTLVVLPEMHIDDEFYHWSHYYDQLKQADLVLANSMYSKNELFDRIGAKSVCLGPGIDDTVFLSPDVDGGRFREKYGFEDKQIILTVSRKSPSKRYDMLISAMASLHQDYPDAHLVMIGPDEDRVPIDAAGVTYLGKAPETDLVDAYDACDTFAMMSESESFGMVFCEAWSRKKPVIGNRYCGAVASLIEDHVNGCLCGNVSDIESSIRLFLDDKTKACQFGSRGYQKAISNYTWPIISERLKSYYEDLIDMN
ncbi:glycosyltransferase family 4 protein [Methanofollis sp. UBA420]|jgi:glycosyltransferase involved in cell wall biosynthesis|uniref:glycosyltransferase family 4 protein n=1 Tax=Methanofollis sp. UBA420 TaxID=1915514 RepID=UPI00316AE7E6